MPNNRLAHPLWDWRAFWEILDPLLVTTNKTPFANPFYIAVPYQDLRSWIENYEETVWSALQKTQGYVTVAPEAHVSLHLLCYMVSLGAVAKRAQQLFSTEDTKGLLKQLAEYARQALLTKTGTSLSPRDIKLIPRKDFFENMMGKIIGPKSTVSVLSFSRQWGNRIWFQIFGTPIRPAHACLFLCMSICAVLTLYYLSTGRVERNKLVLSSHAPQNQRFSEYVKTNLTKLL